MPRGAEKDTWMYLLGYFQRQLDSRHFETMNGLTLDGFIRCHCWKVMKGRGCCLVGGARPLVDGPWDLYLMQTPFCVPICLHAMCHHAIVSHNGPSNTVPSEHRLYSLKQ